MYFTKYSTVYFTTVNLYCRNIVPDNYALFLFFKLFLSEWGWFSLPHGTYRPPVMHQRRGFFGKQFADPLITASHEVFIGRLRLTWEFSIWYAVLHWLRTNPGDRLTVLFYAIKINIWKTNKINYYKLNRDLPKCCIFCTSFWLPNKYYGFLNTMVFSLNMSQLISARFSMATAGSL